MCEVTKYVQFAPFLTQWCLWELCCPASLTRNGLGMFAGASASLISPWFKVMQLRKTLYFHLKSVTMFLLYLFSLQFYHLLLALSLSLLQMEHDFFPALQSPAAGAPLKSFSSGVFCFCTKPSHVCFRKGLPIILSLWITFPLHWFETQQCLPFPSWNKCFPPL